MAVQELTILNSVKKMIGLTAEDTSFDQDILMNINSVIVILRQLGVGPLEGFNCTDISTWTDYIEDIDKYAEVKTYMYLKVKMMFDPSQNASVLKSMQDQINELEARLNYTHEVDA